MHALENLIRSEIQRRGKVSFAEYMDWVLYHPQHGYYTAGPVRTGRRGDYYTNAQGGPLFARLLVESFCELWDHLGSERFSLVELGGGNGHLAEQMINAFRGKGRERGITYYFVEKSPFARELARRRLSRFPRIKILDDLKSLEHVSGVEGCVFSNEFFDALPFHRVLWQKGVLHELYVREESGRLVEEPGEISTRRLADYLSQQGVSLTEGQRAEICLRMDDVVAEIERVLQRGFVFTLDYGEPSRDLYRQSRRDGTLQVYQKHQRAESPFEDIGDCDITAFVDFGRLAALGDRGDLRPLIFVRQGTYFLNSAEALLRNVVENEAGQAGNASLPAQVQQLVHPESLGGKFQVFIQGKNVGRPALSGGRVNRLHRLRAPFPSNSPLPCEGEGASVTHVPD